MKQIELYFCKHCRNVAWKAHNAGVKLFCCGEPMVLLEPNTVDAAVEKHKPVVEINGNNVHVKVGEVEHPMTVEHFIGFIAVQTSDSEVQFAVRKHDEKPEADFVVKDASKGLIAYAWCNLHGLWTTEK